MPTSRLSRLSLILLALGAAGACKSAGSTAQEPLQARQAGELTQAPPLGDAQRGSQLEAAAGWHAQLALENRPAGVWTVAVCEVFPQYGSPEVVALDDLGRCHVLISYSGQWTDRRAVDDGTWLGGLARGDADPRVEGAELYVGSQSGNVYQVLAHREGVLEARRIAHLPGREVHTLAVARPEQGAPAQLLAFTNPGGLWRLQPRADGGEGFEALLLAELEGRVRDALVLAGAAPDGGDALATVARNGVLALLHFERGQAVWTPVHTQPMGMGRLARRPGAGPLVLYATCDDGTVWRHERRADGSFEPTLIYAGPQGPRGIAAGRFHADPARESVAVFGYSARVELLTRPADGRGAWSVETLFHDRDKGHWLACGELDGRNATDELVASGYGARVVVLARPPGYGLSGVAAGNE